MVKIRLRRQGAKKHAFYRLVVAESSAPRNGRVVAEIGVYDPTREHPLLEVDRERALHWLRHGAQPSETARALLSRAGVWAVFRGHAPAAQAARAEGGAAGGDARSGGRAGAAGAGQA